VSVVSFNEIWNDRGADSGGADDTSINRQWRVVTDNKADDANYIINHGLTHNILPNLYFPHPTNIAATARRIRAESQSETPLHWIVTVVYSTAPLKAEEKEKEDNKTPTNRKAKYQWTTNLFRESVEKDIDGNAILNSAGDGFDPPIERDASNWVVTITKNILSAPSWLLEYNNTPINDSEITIDGVVIEEKTARLATINIGDEQIENGTTFRVLTMQIEIKSGGWDVDVLDQGFRYLKEPEGGGDKVLTEILVKDDNKEMVKPSTPQLLDGEGGLLPTPVDPDDAEFMTFSIYKAKDFSMLPLT